MISNTANNIKEKNVIMLDQAYKSPSSGGPNIIVKKSLRICFI